MAIRTIDLRYVLKTGEEAKAIQEEIDYLRRMNYHTHVHARGLVECFNGDCSARSLNFNSKPDPW